MNIAVNYDLAQYAKAHTHTHKLTLKLTLKSIIFYSFVSIVVRCLLTTDLMIDFQYSAHWFIKPFPYISQ